MWKRCPIPILGIGNDIPSGRSRSWYKIKRPIERGLVTDWNDMESIWQYSFNNLRVTVEECVALLLESPTNPKVNREKMTQIMFERFLVPAMLGVNNAVMSLFASGRTTGLVLSCGEDISHSVPIYEGHALSQNTNNAQVGGRHLIEYLQRLLHEREDHITRDEEQVRFIKEKYCKIALDFNSEEKEVKEYELPDGTTIFMGEETFKSPELLLQPNLNNMDSLGIREIIVKSIENSDPDIKRDLRENIILSGGSTLFPGMDDRLRNDLFQSFKQQARIIAPPERSFSAWIGGSILGSLGLHQHWICKEEYEDTGAAIIHRKCF